MYKNNNSNNKFFKKKKKGEKKKNRVGRGISTEQQKPNVEAEVYNSNKECD